MTLSPNLSGTLNFTALEEKWEPRGNSSEAPIVVAARKRLVINLPEESGGLGLGVRLRYLGSGSGFRVNEVQGFGNAKGPSTQIVGRVV